MFIVGLRAMVCMWRAENSLMELIFSYFCMGPGDATQVGRLAASSTTLWAIPPALFLLPACYEALHTDRLVNQSFEFKNLSGFWALQSHVFISKQWMFVHLQFPFLCVVKRSLLFSMKSAAQHSGSAFAFTPLPSCCFSSSGTESSEAWRIDFLSSCTDLIGMRLEESSSKLQDSLAESNCKLLL